MQLLGGGGRENIRTPSHFFYWGSPTLFSLLLSTPLMEGQRTFYTLDHVHVYSGVLL